jgi:hypothetical protein
MGLDYNIMLDGEIGGEYIKIMLKPEEIDRLARPVLHIGDNIYYFDNLSDVQEIFNDITSSLKRKKDIEKDTVCWDKTETFMFFNYATHHGLCYLTIDGTVIEVSSMSMIEFNKQLDKQAKWFYNKFHELSHITN